MLLCPGTLLTKVGIWYTKYISLSNPVPGLFCIYNMLLAAASPESIKQLYNCYILFY
jgi:hypothetical protein